MSEPEPTPINGIVRAATAEDLPYLRLKLEQMKQDTAQLENRVVYVIEHNGIISGMVGARMVWQVEPLVLFPNFTRHAPPVSVRRAVFKLARAIEEWLRGPGNRTNQSWYFGYVEKKPMQRVCEEYGMLPIYRKGKMFAKDL